MLRLVGRRAWVQRRLLSVVVLLVALATTLLGFCSLILGVTGPRSFSEQVQRAQPQEVGTTAYVLGVAAPDLDGVRRDARSALDDALAPVHPTLVSTATSRMRRLDGSPRLAYLATSDAYAGLANLTSGRWPRDSSRGPAEAVAPADAARLLHLGLGDRLTLGGETGLDPSVRPVTVVIVGTFRAASRAAWDSDPLAGAGFSPSYTDGSATGPAYGPFMTSSDAFVATGSSVDALRVDAQPDLSTATDDSLRAAVGSLGSATALLSDRVGDSARVTRVASGLPETLDRLHAEQSVTRSAVLVVALLGVALGLAAVLMAGGLVAESRVQERALLTALGLDRGQQLRSSLVEAGILATAAAVVSVPAAALVHAAVTHLAAFRSADLTQGPTVTVALVGTTFVAAALLTVAFVLAPLVVGVSERLSGRRRAVARSGLDVLLLVLAGVAWWQLHSRPATATGSDVLLIAAPVVWLVAAAVVAVRLLPPLLALAAAAGSRSRALLPVSLHSAALRLNAGTALALITTASASAVFGVALHSTWQRSQDDQADVRVGTEVSLTLASPPTAEDASAIAGAAGSQVMSPVTARPVALGNYLNRSGTPPALVALDTREAGALLLGRLGDGETWSGVGQRLAPRTPVHGVPLPAGGSGVTMVGTSPAGLNLSVTPRLVVQDATGVRTTLDAAPLPADGRPHPVEWSTTPSAGQRVVAVVTTFAQLGNNALGDSSTATVSAALRVPATGHTHVADWWAGHLDGSDSPVTDQSVSVRSAQDGATILTTRAQLNSSYLLYVDGQVLATGFEPPQAVPVAVSQDLVDALGTKVGDELAATVGNSALRLQVVEVVPTVPSASGRIALLADVDTLSRALIGTGLLEPVVDAFWFSGHTDRTAPALSALGVGEVTSRSEVSADLRTGPMRVTEPLAYVTLGVSALLLLLAGAALVVGADERARTAEVTRLRALGLTRAGARRLLLVEHGALLLPLVVAGVLIGGATAAALGPSLVRSDAGTAPVPSTVLAWPWTTELVVVGGLVLGCLLIAAIAAAAQVRRSDTARLRTDEWQ